jgi:hypothetical protein
VRSRNQAGIYLLIAGLALANIVPVWCFPYFPSQDGPSHLEGAYILLHYSDKDADFASYYDVRPALISTWLLHATLALFMKVSSPLVAEKLFLTLYLAVFVGCILYFVRSFGGSPVLVLLAFPLAWGQLLHKGFYNFSLSVPLAFLAMGFWWRSKDRGLSWNDVLKLNLLLLVVYLFHIVSEVLAIAGVSTMAAVHYRANLRRFVRLVPALLPACALPLAYVIPRRSEGGLHRGWAQLASRAVDLDCLFYYDRWQMLIGWLFAVLIAALLVYTIWGRLRGSRLGASHSPLLAAAVFTVIYLAVPAWLYGGGDLPQRIKVFPAISLLPWLVLPVGFWRRALVVGAVGLVLVQLGISTHYYRILNRGLEEYTSGMHLVEKNHTVLPLSFNHVGRSALVQVYRHAGSYYCLGAGAVHLAYYQADKDYFPLRYKPDRNPFGLIAGVRSTGGGLDPARYSEPIDIILQWDPVQEFRAKRWIERNYDLVHRRGRLRVYRHNALAGKGTRTSE